MKYMAGILIGLAAMTAQASHTIKITIAGLPAAPATDLLYIAGNFNNWNPRDDQFRLQKNEQGLFFIELQHMPAGSYQFKFTRGSWNTGETDEKGVDLPNRALTVAGDTSLQLSIAGWKDGFAQAPQHSTASAQVAIVDTAFPIPELNRTRRIWIYLPADYATSAKRYPVLYMHDGQNLFDDATSFAGEWGVDEAMDSLKNACIVVGIDNGGAKRMTEYNPNDTKQYGKGEGRAYLLFIVNTLKPYIDKKYRTMPARQHTWMAGSSMGGLISFYAGLYYPQVFGGLGIFSPSFWIAPQLKTQLKHLANRKEHAHQKYYFYAGGSEGRNMAPDMQAMAAALKQAAGVQVTTVVNPQGKHNEPTWRAAFPLFYQWLRR